MRLMVSDCVPHQVQRRREEEEAVSVSLRKLEKKLVPLGGDRGDSSSDEEMELDLDALRKQTMQRLGPRRRRRSRWARRLIVSDCH